MLWSIYIFLSIQSWWCTLQECTFVILQGSWRLMYISICSAEVCVFCLSVGNYGHIRSRASPFELNRKIDLLILDINRYHLDICWSTSYCYLQVMRKPTFESWGFTFCMFCVSDRNSLKRPWTFICWHAQLTVLLNTKLPKFKFFSFLIIRTNKKKITVLLLESICRGFSLR